MTTTLERGFKSWAERTATTLRKDLSLSSNDPLNPRALASRLQVQLCTPADIVGLSADAKHQLLVVDPSGWSAVTIEGSNSVLIIYNPSHADGRQASDITHELAHVILGHKAATLIMSHNGSFVMRSYDQKQEEEASWLSAALLLPRDALLYCRRMKLAAGDIADRFGVSEQLVSYRIRITGVDSQLKAGRRFTRR